MSSVSEIEKLVKKHIKNLARSETKSLVQFHNLEKEFVCGYSEKQNQINFYFQPLYDNPKAFEKIKLILKPYLKGKSCLHLPEANKESLKVIEQLLKIYSGI